MKARSIARECALWLHYGLGLSGESIPRDWVYQALHSMRTYAEDELNQAAGDIRSVYESVQSFQDDHPDNENVPYQLPTQSVPIPWTADLVSQMEKLLIASDTILNAMHFPELIEQAKEQHVQNYVTMLLKGLETYSHSINKLLAEHLIDWRPERLLKLDKCILELALSEMLSTDAVEKATIINEYVELSKHYCGEESYKLINGTLESITSYLNTTAV